MEKTIFWLGRERRITIPSNAGSIVMEMKSPTLPSTYPAFGPGGSYALRMVVLTEQAGVEISGLYLQYNKGGTGAKSAFLF